MFVTVTLNSQHGITLGPRFYLSCNVGTPKPSFATLSELLAGKVIEVPDSATQIIVTSNGACTNSITLTIGEIPTTTTTTAAPTTTTAAPTTTTAAPTTTTAAPTTTTAAPTTTTAAPTTTSTTTSGGGAPACTYNGLTVVCDTTTTTTAGYTTFLITFTSTGDGAQACTDFDTPTNRNPYYAAPGAILTNGTVLYTNTALTTPAANGYYSNGAQYWNTGASAGMLANGTACDTPATTTTTTAAPTTTTAAPSGTFTIKNTSGSGLISDVYGPGGIYFYVTTAGSFPISTGQQVDAGGASLTGSDVIVEISSFVSTSCLSLYINGGLSGQLQVDATGQHTFTNKTFTSTDVVLIEYVSGTCA
jgi:hypothetical protein